jgi:hypothetical protein
MPTKWVVTTPGDRIELDDTQHGQTTFTVTNPTNRVDRVAFDIVPLDGAQSAWFSVDEPQRRVPPGGSVSYVVTTAIPPETAPGSYAMQGRAYSADSAPEEDSAASGRLAINVLPKAVPLPRRRFPWWIAAVAGLVMVAIVVVVVLVTTSGGPAPVATPSRAPGKNIIMPDLSNQSGQQAQTNLKAFGLTVGVVRYVLDPKPDRIVYQSVAPGGTVATGTPVDLVVATALAAPAIVAPANGAQISLAAVTPAVAPVPSTPTVPTGTSTPTGIPVIKVKPPVFTIQLGLLRWSDGDRFVKRWHVVMYQNLCVNSAFQPAYTCRGVVVGQARVDQPEYSPILALPAPAIAVAGAATHLANSFSVTVAAVDDFGNAGPSSAPVTFSLK